MVEKIIAWCVRNPFLVVLLTLFGIGWGIYAVVNIPLDAIPDLSDPQVIVFTEWKGRSPDIMEDQITYPIVSAMVAAPHVAAVRGYSMFGMSFVYLIFKEDTDLYWARSRVLEYLSKIGDNLPEGVNPVLGPDASGVGWVFSYSLVDRSGKNSLEDLRSLQDWKLRYLIEAIPGVAEVASVGGFVKEYQIQVNPNALAQHGLTLKDVMERVQSSNRDVGGRVLEISEREYFIRGLGYLKNQSDIENIVLKAGDRGEKVLVHDVARVDVVPEIRRGGTDLNGEGEAVSAIVVMRYGEDVLSGIGQVKKTLKRLEPSLPEGVEVLVTYDRSKIILRSIKTLSKKLAEEMMVVALVILIFLLHFRSSLVPLITLPIGVLLAYIPMYHLGISSNIMSLGGIAIAIGAMVDAAIILVENAHKSYDRWQVGGQKQNLSETLLSSAQEVGRPIFYSLLVIAVSFMPIFTLTGQEGRLFKPLAFTKNFSMFFAAVLAITLAPVLIQYFFRQASARPFKGKMVARIYRAIWAGHIYSEEKHPISRVLHQWYEPILNWVLARRKKAVIVAVVLVLSTLPVYLSLGQEFMPTLNEGDVLYMPTTLPGISITEAREWLQQQDKIIRQFAEVETVFGKIGRAETPTDPAPLSMVETVVQLKPHEDWPRVYRERWYSSRAPEFIKNTLRLIWPERQRRTWQELITSLNNTVRLPGTTNAWVFPIKNRIDMLTTGIRTPVGIKVFGDDLKTVDRIAVDIESLVQKIPGTRSVIADRSLGGYYIDIKLRRDQLALYGITVEDANELIEGMIGGKTVTTLIDGRARYSVNVRYQAGFRSDVEQLKNSLVTVASNKHVPLKELADVQVTQGPAMIKDEGALLTTWVYVDMEPDTDVQAYVERLNQAIVSAGIISPGYTYKITGQYEHLQRAKKRMLTVVPVTLIIILLLLYFNTGSWVRTGIVMLAVPFSLIGAFWFLYLLGYKMSVAVWVGMIALAGVDAETGVIMLLYLDLAFKEHKQAGRLKNLSDLKEAIMEGAVKRVRPKVMTVLTTFTGLLPIMWAAAHESGADVAKRIAAPMVGGIFTSFILELLIYPCIYMMWKGKKLR